MAVKRRVSPVDRISRVLDVDVETARKIYRQVQRGRSGSGRTVENALEQISDLMGAYGVETIRGEHIQGGFWMDAVAAYVNVGDPYVSTVLYDVDRDRLTLEPGGYGAWVEWYEKEHGELP